MVKPMTSLPKDTESRPTRWPLRRTLALVLIVSGILWLIAGIVIRFLIL
jgi:hypothetical protein